MLNEGLDAEKAIAFYQDLVNAGAQAEFISE
jgi:hypothetical protein